VTSHMSGDAPSVFCAVWITSYLSSAATTLFAPSLSHVLLSFFRFLKKMSYIVELIIQFSLFYHGTDSTELYVDADLHVNY
jgi:hypothetical protein